MFLFPLGSQSQILKNITISGDQTNWNLITDGFGGVAPTKKTVLTLTVNAGVDIISASIALAALDLTGLPKDSTIALLNSGSIMGRGGDGGHGEDTELEQEAPCFSTETNMTSGQAGGPAIVYDGNNVDLAITNAGAEIFAGGGGGGGGDSCAVTVPPCRSNAGGGGGGGAGGSASAGFGSGGVKGTQTPQGSGRNGSAGSAGSGGSGGVGGSGGAGGTGTGCTPGAGGTGGEFGAAGSVGGAGGAAGGSGGLAIDNDGSGTTSWTSGGSQGVDVKGTVQ